jgi:hypothetical protein
MEAATDVTTVPNTPKNNTLGSEPVAAYSVERLYWCTQITALLFILLHCCVHDADILIYLLLYSKFEVYVARCYINDTWSSQISHNHSSLDGEFQVFWGCKRLAHISRNKFNIQVKVTSLSDDARIIVHLSILRRTK